MNLSVLDVADRVADLLPSLDRESPAFADACAWFAAQLNVDSYTPHSVPLPDARAFDGRRGGGVPDMPGAPADHVGKYDVKRGRGKNGATVEVKRRRVAPVIGRMDVDCHGAPILATPAEGSADVANPAWAMAQMLTRHVRRVPGGYSSADVLHVTSMGAALEDLPMLGTDAVAWAEVIAGDRSSRSPVAAQRSDLTGLAHHPTLGRFAAHVGANGPQTRLRWAPRLRIAYRARKSDPASSVRVADPGERVDVSYDVRIGPWWSCTRGDSLTPRRLKVTIPTPVTHVHALTSPGDTTAAREIAPDGHIAVTSAPPERLHVGRTTIARAARQDRDKNGAPVKRGAIKARTLVALDAEHSPETVDGWQALAAMLNRGERLTACDGLVTMTRGKAGKYRATDRRGDETMTYEVRTPDALALRLAH